MSTVTMAEDSLDALIDEIGDKFNDGGPWNKEAELEAKAAINVYTTNKILNELENLQGLFVETSGFNEIIDNRYAELKALNHRKDEHGDSK